jgi:hypothetical protein
MYIVCRKTRLSKTFAGIGAADTRISFVFLHFPAL